MHNFHGTVQLINEPDSVLDAKVTVDNSKVSIRADDTEIGTWRRSEVSVAKKDDGVHLNADGDTLLLQIDGRDFFVDLLNEGAPSPGRSRRERRKPQTPREGSGRFSLADVKAIAREEGSDQIDRRLAIVIAVAAGLILLGAAFTWGPFRILETGSFPIARLLAAIGGLGGLAGLYLAYFDRSRAMGSAAAVSAGIVTFCIVYIYARSAHLGIGFMLALIGSQALVAAGVLGLRQQNDEKPVE